MELLNHFNYVNGAQTVFVIQPGKQVTLHAKGLEDDDTVYIEVLELSSSPDFKGNPCCTFKGKEIQVLRRTTLLCPDGREVTLTAEYPTGVLEYPQGVTLGVRVEASDEAMVSIELHETESDGCLACICDRPCEITSWLATGQERCTGTNVEKEEESNCGTKRWVVDRPQVWTPTGSTRCLGTNVEFQEANQCGDIRWVIDRPQTWIPTSLTRCVDNVVQAQEANDCGDLRWTVTAQGCGFCASYAIPRSMCEGQDGFAFRLGDVRDPAATVAIEGCDADIVDTVYIYPSAGAGHSVPVYDCDHNLLGYAANVSECTQTRTQYLEIQSLPNLNVQTLPALKISEMPDLKIPELPALSVKYLPPLKVSDFPKLEVSKLPKLKVSQLPALHIASLPAVTLSNVGPTEISSLPALTVQALPLLKFERHVVSTQYIKGMMHRIWSDGVRTEEIIEVIPVKYCASLRVMGYNNVPAYGYHYEDPKDPAATVEVDTYLAAPFSDKAWIYPSAGEGHTVKVVTPGGVLIGYAVNTSTCASDCGCN